MSEPNRGGEGGARGPISSRPASNLGPKPETHAAVASVFREEVGLLTGSLMRMVGNFDLAEELVQDALLVAIERWPAEGIPRRPGAWLLTVARRRAINQLKRDVRYRDKLSLLEEPSPGEPDDRLRL